MGIRVALGTSQAEPIRGKAMKRFLRYVLFPACGVTVAAMVAAYFAALTVFRADAKINGVNDSRRKFNRFIIEQLD